ncbi:MAG: UDP-N-acetylmuramoyl-tripeptide--D-alanyl-D-alanine ligase [Lachnospiraceae bacterium]|jgi:UDP-N-acetylmuramoyl-tripeptide--D-alanyl-D-alanine ligase|nr:UDP-N-acetylmuramoyl-tripeptide--D-alanyl-D-alanine ligase [Lachnospiraceae bacterium]
MKNMTLKNITATCSGELVGTPTAAEVTGVVIDSRLLTVGNLFIATRGAQVDGHSFITSVAANGAAAVVCEEPPDTDIDIPYILVTDSFQALKDIASYYRKQLDITVIAITGSVGKTSTKEFVAAVLAERFSVLKTAGNFNNEIGLPLTILQIRAEHQVAVLELGINNFNEMSRLSQISCPDIAVITNIGDCHLQNLGNRAGVLRAKSEIFDYLADDGWAIVNAEDEWLDQIKTVKNKTPLRFGSDITADDVRVSGLEGSDAYFTIHHKSLGTVGTSFPVHIPIPGEHMITCALIAATVGGLMGLASAEIAKGLLNIQSVLGRSHIVRLAQMTIIDDCYNANPHSMKAAIRLLQRSEGRKVAILGDMFELGSEEMAFHAQIGRDAVAAKIDVLVCIGQLAEHIHNAAVTYALNSSDSQLEMHYFESKESFIAELTNILRHGDTVLVKASNGMKFFELVEKIKDNAENCHYSSAIPSSKK